MMYDEMELCHLNTDYYCCVWRERKESSHHKQNDNKMTAQLTPQPEGLHF